ncbi:MAG: 3-octaprenyl-4-hydroxybenzoate carboxy-lyase, partial [Ferruginibacter sp.]
FLFITADDTHQLSTHLIEEYLQFILRRIQLHRDVHFYTNTTIDTLDYSGTGLNSGSKVVFAAYGDEVRKLATEVPAVLNNLQGVHQPTIVMPGVIAIGMPAFSSYENTHVQIKMLQEQLCHNDKELHEAPMIILADDAAFVAASMKNFLWVSFTRCNPSHDIYGINESVVNKHWGCTGPLLIDARIKPHHAPPVEKDPDVEKKINRFFEKGGSLYGCG